MAHVRTRKIKENCRIAGQGRGLNAHRMVAETAMRLAESEYADFMSVSNFWWNIFRNAPPREARILYLSVATQVYLESARGMLTDALSLPDDECGARVKGEIVDALVKDTDLRANRLALDKSQFFPAVSRLLWDRYMQPKITMH